MITHELNQTLNTLNRAINENESALNDCEKGYPYAAGYSRSAMKSAINDIENLLRSLND